ncbi:MAG: uracil-DNA glycosylase [Desulfobacteraceae bacterium]|nr:uracil-DNA glycosylase [Desulfobacteraceae bacterium]MBU4000737.1 uracil-DNA glycosylase [Pseudomonadota bacterium]
MATDRNIITDISDYLQFLKEAGVSGFDCSEQTLKTISTWGTSQQKNPTPPVEPGDSESLAQILADLSDCRGCKLCGTRRNIVFGSGNPDAKLVFVGEGPGNDEDMAGEPFVGKAGQLLTKIIEAIQLSRDQVYICNIVKCRPPENRNPEPDEINACLPWLKRQIRAIQPEYICALGTVAARALLHSQAPISGLRGRFFDFEGIRVLPTFHPAYLLRNPDKKREVWKDMQLLMKTMGAEGSQEPVFPPKG